MKKIKLAIVGTNFIVNNFIDAVNHLDVFEITVLFTRNPKNIEKLNLDAKYVKVFSNFKHFCEEPSYEAVYVASPNYMHKEQSNKLLACGKHVLCEKPLASNLKEVESMFNCADWHNAIIMEAMRPLYHMATQAISEGVKRIGKLHFADLRFCQYSSRYDDFKNGVMHNAFNPNLSNGACMDIGIYPIELMVYLFDMPDRIHVFGDILDESIDAKGHLIAIFGQMLCQISYSKVSNSYLPCEIQGEEGALLFDKIPCCNKVWIIWKNGKESVLYDGLEHNDMIYELEKFYEAIRYNDVNINKDISIKSISIIDQLRAQLKIIFPADKE
jgi:predicted dehydrogenase